MITIEKASVADASEILAINKRSFLMYRDALPDKNIPVAALGETEEEARGDIETNHVYVARIQKKIIGSIRFALLSSELAYIYKFGVDPDVNNNGVGTDLIGRAISDCAELRIKAIALHTNSKYYRLARYYYGKGFYVHSTDASKGYIRALFVKELSDQAYDLSPAFKH